jgi:hypothetical protein
MREKAESVTRSVSLELGLGPNELEELTRGGKRINAGLR